jgi:ankyrin repeat protein
MVGLLLGDNRISIRTGSSGHTPIEEAITQRSTLALGLLLSPRGLTLDFDRREEPLSHAKAIGYGEAISLIEELHLWI